MHRMLLGLAVCAALTAPGHAKTYSAAAFNASAAFHATAEAPGDRVKVHRFGGIVARHGGDRPWRWRGAFGFAYPPEFYDAGYDIDRSWQSDSFNDWWNDRPDRAYPRWVWHNRDCTEDRMWWSGGGWRCSP